MKKGLVCAFGGLISFVSLFLGYATLCLNFGAGIPEAMQQGAKQQFEGAMNGDLGISFYDFVTKWENKTTIWSTIAVVLVVLAILCMAAVFVGGVLAIIKKDSAIADTFKTKWLAIAALVFMGGALVIGGVFPDLPPSPMPEVFELGTTFGLGSIVFLAAAALTSVTQFFVKD